MPKLDADPRLTALVTRYRNQIRDLGKGIRRLMEPTGLLSSIPTEFGLRSEAYADVMLAYRHLEDARMRLGKVMQQAQGGESIFDGASEESVGEPR